MHIDYEHVHLITSDIVVDFQVTYNRDFKPLQLLHTMAKKHQCFFLFWFAVSEWRVLWCVGILLILPQYKVYRLNKISNKIKLCFVAHLRVPVRKPTHFT